MSLPCRFLTLAIVALAAAPVGAKEEKLAPEDRILLTRELTAEYATAKVILPRSKKALPFNTDGSKDEAQWSDAHDKYGPAAGMGDMIQITKVEFEKKRIILVINGGFKGGRKWYERIQISGTSSTTRIPSNRRRGGAAGTKIALEFPSHLPTLETDDIKQYLEPLMDFEQRSATEQYVEQLPEPVQAAIEERRAIEGMNQDMVLLAMGKPVRKVRETKEGIEYEDWVYGTPPGKVTFVTFKGSKVVKIREMYAGVGGSVAPPLEPR